MIDKITTPEQCRGCVRLRWCRENDCLKEKPCRQRKQTEPVDADLLAEIRERIR